MASQNEAEVVLYDLACTKGVCFSPVVWRIRIMLNYKKVPYKTVFLEFQEIEPTLKNFGIPPHSKGIPYTVPAIHHIPSDKHIMDSPVVAKFLEETYPSPPVILDSPLGDQILADARAIGVSVFRSSLMPREIHILSPSAAEHFQTTRTAMLGHPPQDLLQSPEQEDEAWAGIEGKLRANGALMRTRKDEGPLIEGTRLSWADAFVAGNMQCARVIHEGTFERLYGFEGYREVYDACEKAGLLERKD